MSFGDYFKGGKVKKYAVFLAGVSGIGSAIYKIILDKDTKRLKSDTSKIATPLIPEEDISKMSSKELKRLSKSLPPYMQKRI